MLAFSCGYKNPNKITQLSSSTSFSYFSCWEMDCWEMDILIKEWIRVASANQKYTIGSSSSDFSSYKSTSGFSPVLTSKMNMCL